MITIEFIISHFDEDRANALYAIMQFVTFFTVWTCYICFAKQKHLTFDFLTNMHDIVDNYSKFLVYRKCICRAVRKIEFILD